MLRLATLKVKLYKFPDDPAHQEFCERSLYLSDCKTTHIIIFFFNSTGSYCQRAHKICSSQQSAKISFVVSKPLEIRAHCYGRKKGENYQRAPRDCLGSNTYGYILADICRITSGEKMKLNNLTFNP